MKIVVNRDSSVPIRDQLIEQIGLQIASGVLKGAERLPSIRALATRLGIHYNTVSSAYNQLAEMGLLEVRQGSGVTVARKLNRRELEVDEGNIDGLLSDFLALAADRGFSRKDLEEALSRVVSSKPVSRIVVIDRNEDFHPLLRAELSPHFELPVEPAVVEDVAKDPPVTTNALVVTSLYHLFSLKELNLDPTRLVVCHVEPARRELEGVVKLRSGTMVLLVSVSPTLMKMATNIIAALRGEEVAVRTVSPGESDELAYTMKYADMVICDRPSKDAVEAVAGEKHVEVFRLYSDSTIELIKQRLKTWG